MATQNPRTGTSQQLVQVTLSNALDQREKRLIEIAPSQTVRDAVIQAEMAPSGQFDVFSSVGEVVTQKTAERSKARRCTSAPPESREVPLSI